MKVLGSIMEHLHTRFGKTSNTPRSKVRQAKREPS
jgi:hypothetical protein